MASLRILPAEKEVHMALGIEKTSFTLDVIGRFTCNHDEEALAAIEGPHARPFDVIVVGGGSFGPILAENIYFDDKTHSRRVLVLEAGPMVLPEHQQNLPVLGGEIEKLVRDEPWASNEKLGFAGLRVMIGGRSAFFGGWSPQLLDNAKHTEMPRTHWPDEVVQELKNSYFPRSAQQLAVDETNDFIFGPLHEVLRQRLADRIDAGDVGEAIPLDDLDLHLAIDPATPAAEQRLLRLEAPLAVQTKSPRSGFFPFNKFSTIPLIVRCAREAQFEVERLLNPNNDGSEGDNTKKRFMILPRIVVTKLETSAAPNGEVRVTKIKARRREQNGNEPGGKRGKRSDRNGDHRVGTNRVRFLPRRGQRWDELHGPSPFERGDPNSAVVFAAESAERTAILRALRERRARVRRRDSRLLPHADHLCGSGQPDR
jgi:choline dehydrogenase-like flavoprotein